CQLSYTPRNLLHAWRLAEPSIVLLLRQTWIEGTEPPIHADTAPDIGDQAMILATTPAPTVRPPSRMAKRRPSSIAIGASSLTVIVTLSPGSTISLSLGRSIVPVTSVVRK